jgi:ribonuclease Y
MAEGLFSQFFKSFLKPPKKKAPPQERVAPPKKEEPREPVRPRQAEAIIDAQAQAREIILEAKDEAIKIKRQAEEEARPARITALEIEAKLAQSQEQIEQKLANLEEQEKTLKEKETQITKELAELKEKRTNLVSQLEKTASLTTEEARKIVLAQVEEDLKTEIAKRIKEKEEQVQREADKIAQQIIISAMQKGATDYVAEYTVSTVKLSDEEMKGRIIGKEGRNIRALELATGVDIDLEEEGIVRLSSFDPIRREIAKRALERLIADGRIQPTRIEEFVEREKRQVEKAIFEAGEQLAYEAKIPGLPPALISLLGKFKFRTSFGQNQWLHTLEVVRIATAIAQSIGANVDLIRRIALFHDIGKVVDEEGPQEEVGANILRKFNLPENVIAGVATQHKEEFSSLESALVFVADAISAARPGARHEPHEEYVKRISEIEKIAQAHEGVEKAYALEAGREVRVLVVPEKVSDDEMVKIAHDIAQEVREKVQVPGQLKVTTIREVRASSAA